MRKHRVYRSLCPSSATLIIVPQFLLEHWYEQILRHLRLGYFTSDEEQRGVVYLDGLGDIVDVEAPISKLLVQGYGRPIESSHLSHYLIVITTFERCLQEGKNLGYTASAESVLLRVRWLRLIIDEGHELGQGKKLERERKRGREEEEEQRPGKKAKAHLSQPQSQVQAPLKGKAKAKAPKRRRRIPLPEEVTSKTTFIMQIAAERRWVMSGTPTTGSNSALALQQLYRLLHFLRHPRLLKGAPLDDWSGSGCSSSRSGSSSSSSGSSSSSSSSGSSSSSEEGASVAVVASDASDAGATVVRRTDFAPASSSASTPAPASTPASAPGSAPAEGSKDYPVDLSLSDDDDEPNIPTPMGFVPASNAPTSVPTSAPAPALIPTTPPSRSRAKAPTEWGPLTPSAWHQEVIIPCLAQNRDAWEGVVELLRSVLLRHTKEALRLYAPIYRKHENLKRILDLSEADSYDLPKALYIAETMANARRKWKAIKSGTGDEWKKIKVMKAPEKELEKLLYSRRPKAIVFCEDKEHLRGVAHHCIINLGREEVCEHVDVYASCELSRFRHSKRKHRTCPMCGYKNQVSEGSTCRNVLYMVEYLDVLPDAPVLDAYNQPHSTPTPPVHPPQPAGHGYQSNGGHFVGCCLCSYNGCASLGKLGCPGHPNPFFGGPKERGDYANPNYALVRPGDILNYVPGKLYTVGEEVNVLSAEAYDCGGCGACAECGGGEGTETSRPLLWRSGRRGGFARIRNFKDCGGRDSSKGWCGAKQLIGVPWYVKEENASLLFLQKKGCEGLDLSFATHIFLLDIVHDPALKNQIISRAHRIGATGPVQVYLVRVIEKEVGEEGGQTAV
ncbi:hypothetical protein B484DRAFT_405046 [Ochromonadaceae sp. CCMP2298]|nr:hypothetical protein B484DRAFT_405046 [Ochromonadaceae sp. CCMP2298]